MCKVHTTGYISSQGERFKVGKAFGGHPVALRPTATDGKWRIYFWHQHTRTIDLNDRPAFLEALRAPLDDIAFVPTGDINAENIAAYVQAGAVAVGVGSALVAGPEQDLADVAERAEQLISALQRARGT